MTDTNQEIDELIVCEWGGCTEGAPCENHHAFRTLPKPVKQAINRLLTLAREDELDKSTIAIEARADTHLSQKDSFSLQDICYQYRRHRRATLNQSGERKQG